MLFHSFGASDCGIPLEPGQTRNIDFRWHVHVVMTPNEPIQLSKQKPKDMSNK